MGTKTTPGRFDCYARAEPNEPLFVLLARDPAGAGLVEMWCELRAELIRIGVRPREDMIKVVEAHSVAQAMRDWRAHRDGSADATRRLEVSDASTASDIAIAIRSAPPTELAIVARLLLQRTFHQPVSENDVRDGLREVALEILDNEELSGIDPIPASAVLAKPTP